ncbi:cytochrome P450 2K1-like [Nothobranchius furzeri]|uniref:Cytochrome P450 2K1-like n=1 Tax=Nothobranchius furzeri TaxID=105023 RepID=A0A8C6L5P8_NOTFU|nr:cytochrome P450 2K1-like [Nothobranchius furzeri]
MAALDLFLQTFSPASLLTSVLLLLLVCLYVLPTFSSQKQKPGPPGPKPLPIVGNLLQLDLKRPDKTFLEFSKKYGSVFMVYMGQRKVVILSGYKTVKEALVNYAEEFEEREVPALIKDVHLNHGIVFENGDSWREMRRFALMNLKDFGMGKKACEDKITEECRFLLQEIHKFQGEAFDTNQVINYAVSNIISSMVYGSRFDYDDPDFRTIVTQTNKSITLLGSQAIKLYNFFPRIGIFLLSARKQICNIFAANNKHHSKLLRRLKETINPQMCRGVADAFLIRQQQIQESGNTNSHFHDVNLLVTIQNLFSAGTDTTATTLRWALLLMAKYPQMQDQVQEELNRVLGGRQVLVKDRLNLPFTNAVVHETQRFANIAPLSVAHRTSKDVTFQGHFIKKGTPVFPLLTSVLQDESEWEKPDMFYPAHFLDKDGKFLKRDAFLPFSAGRRMCPGESLAKMELFIFFSTLLQHFRFTPPPGVPEDKLDLNPIVGGTLSPQPHKLCAVRRV